MPKRSDANPDIRLDFDNEHFGYFYKFGILTNVFGIPLKIHFLMRISILHSKKILKLLKIKNIAMIMLH